VSHGSVASAKLVRETIAKRNPSCVVLKLCDERYFAMCLDSKIPPNGNDTMLNMYQRKITAVEKQMRETGLEMGRSNTAFALAFADFVKREGPITGSFVTIGLIVSAVQRLFRPSEVGDEFITAMKMAEYMNIPIKLGDAQQSATLRSVQKVASFETLNPSKVWEGTVLLAFSTFGWRISARPERELDNAALNAGEFTATWRNRLRDALDKSRWLSLPQVYSRNKSLVLSLSPLLGASLLTVVLGYLLDSGADGGATLSGPSGSAGNLVGASSVVLAQLQLVLGKVIVAAGSVMPVHSAAVLKPAVQAAATNLGTTTAAGNALTALQHALAATAMVHTHLPASLLLHSATAHAVLDKLVKVWDATVAVLRAEPPPAVARAVNVLSDVLSFLLIVRLGKLIGSDRDRIIASKIRDACKVYPVSCS
jgi:hypothetical protein